MPKRSGFTGSDTNISIDTQSEELHSICLSIDCCQEKIFKLSACVVHGFSPWQRICNKPLARKMPYHARRIHRAESMLVPFEPRLSDAERNSSGVCLRYQCLLRLLQIVSMGQRAIAYRNRLGPYPVANAGRCPEVAWGWSPWPSCDRLLGNSGDGVLGEAVAGQLTWSGEG